MTLALNEQSCSGGQAVPTAFAGLELQHDLQLSVSDWRDWDAVALHVRGLGAELAGLNLSRQDAGFSLRCRLTNISSEAARGLSQALIAAGLAKQASVEHLMLARGARHAG
jgi:hypothetical protein